MHFYIFMKTLNNFMMDNNFYKDDFDKDFNDLRTEEDSIIIRDGIVDPKKYAKAKLRILWVLKDPNSPDATEDWDLRGAIKDDLKKEKGMGKDWRKTFNPIVYATYGILENEKWVDIPNISRSFCN